MGIEFSSAVDAPRDEVFDWHSRPGAILRLIPPWQPMSVVAEADSLESGTAVLGLPGGLRWISRHRPEDYDPPARFVDELSHDGLLSRPATVIGSWRHEHRFDVVDEFRTRVTDRVDTPVPGRFLTQTFRYRHRQLADDLASHRWSHAQGIRPGTVAVTGSSGLVGTALTAFLSTGGYQVVRLVRRKPQRPDERRWDPQDPAPTCSKASTPSSTSRARRSRDGSPTPTRPRSATAASNRHADSPNSPRRHPTVLRPSSPRPRSASTVTTEETHRSTRKRHVERVSSPTSSPTGRPRHIPRRRRACGSCTCAPASSRHLAAERSS